MKKITLLLMFALFITLEPSISFAEEKVVVIINPSNSIKYMPLETLSKVYKLKMTNWKTGNTISITNLTPDSPYRKIFSNKFLKRSTKYFKKLYLKMVLSGKGQPPKTFNTSEDLKQYVSKNIGAIGYIDASKVDSSVKVLKIGLIK